MEETLNGISVEETDVEDSLCAEQTRTVRVGKYLLLLKRYASRKVYFLATFTDFILVKEGEGYSS